MSQTNADSGVQNGVPYQWDSAKQSISAPNQNFSPHLFNNGLGSSQSSRDSSPIPKFSNVPISQLPSVRSQIPGSQLPPGRLSLSPVVGLSQQNMGQKSASAFTPHSSPKLQNFNTSTPILQSKDDLSAANNYSSSVNTVPHVQSMPKINTQMLPAQSQDLSLPQNTGYQQSIINKPVPSTNSLTQSPRSQHQLQSGQEQKITNLPISNVIDQQKNVSISEPSISTQPNIASTFVSDVQKTVVSGSTQLLMSQNQLRNMSPDQQKTTVPLKEHSKLEESQEDIKEQSTNSNSAQSYFNQVRTSISQNTQVIPITQQTTQITGILDQKNQSPRIVSTGAQFSPANHKQTSAQHFNIQNQQQIGSSQNQDQQKPNFQANTGQFSAFAPVGKQVEQVPILKPSTTENKLYIEQQKIPPFIPANSTANQLFGQMSRPAMTANHSTVLNQAATNRYPPPNPNNRYPVPQQPAQQGQNTRLPPPQQQLGPATSQMTRYPSMQQQQGTITTQNTSFPPPIQQQGTINQNTNFPAPLQQQGIVANQTSSFPPPMQQQGLATSQNTNFTAPSQQQGLATIHNTSFPAALQKQSARFPYPVQQQGLAVNQNTSFMPPQQPGVNQNTNFASPQQPGVNQTVRPMNPPPLPNQVPKQPPVNYPTQMRPPNFTSPANLSPSNVSQPPIPTSNQYPTTPTSSLHNKRYPQPNYQNQNIQPPNQYPNASNTPTTGYNQQYRQPNTNTPYNQGNQQNYPQKNYQQGLNQQMSNMSVVQSGFNRIWGTENFDLLQCPNILPQERMEPPRISLGQEFLDNANCSPEIFRCTMTKIPETNSLLQKSRLPLGVLIHPFKDLNHLPVIQCSTIVRCRACRTYINPYVFFVDTKRWKCNLCYRVNELPEEFQYDPVSKSYGDPSRRPEIKSSTIEYIAPSEYMLRPPQPAVYLFLLDISRLAIESGYLHTVCEVLSSQLSVLPGDSRTQIGFLAYNSTLHFFSLGEGFSQPHEMTVLDIEDVFLPCPDNLLVNLKERMDLVSDLLALLPTRYVNSYDTGSALGAALQAAFKLMSATGGRVTVFQASLPTIGPGALIIREDPNQRAGKEAPHLNPATDFYKRLALECSGHQIAVDLFIINSQYVDIATLSGISRFSGGCMHHFPLFKASKIVQAESLERCFKRYLTRKIGFEAVMRIRCTRGLAIHTFHGNFFVRSTDLLSLPNVNPDAGFGMQVSIEESLSDLQSVCFQAALLYTSSKGERRIRVHTLCLPICSTLSDVLNSADQQCIVGLLSKMAVDRSQQSSLSDARDAFINVAIDILSSYKMSLNMGDSSSGLLAPHSLKLLPLYILALLKHTAFRSGQSTRLDDRMFAMCEMKSLPITQLLQQVYPDLYPVHDLSDEGGIVDPDGIVIPQPPRLQLTSRNIDSYGAYLLDAGQEMIIYVCPNVSPVFLTHTLGVPSYSAISEQFYELPKIENAENARLHTFINSLNDEKSHCASLQIMRENSQSRTLFLERLIEDRIESALSYNEFLQHVKTQVK